MRAVVHIGMGKTGTSTIQTHLVQNQAGLARQRVLHGRYNRHKIPASVELPMIALNRMGAIQRLDALLAEWMFGVNPDWSAVAAEARRMEALVRADAGRVGFDRQIFSAEHISAGLRDAAQIAALHGFLTELYDDVRYVVYFRSQEDSAASWYSQALRAGLTMDFDAHVRRRGKFDIAAFLRNWSDVVGQERMCVRLFDRKAMVANDLLADFADAAGYALDGLDPIASINESLSLECAELIRALDTRLATLDLPKAVARPLRQNAVAAINRAGGSGDKVRLTADQIAWVRKVNAASNEDVRQTYFPDRPTLFPERPIESIARAPGLPGTMPITDAAKVVVNLLQVIRKLETENRQAAR